MGLKIEKEIQFPDGAPTQYKSKYNFVDISMCHDDFGFSVEKHFFWVKAWERAMLWRSRSD